MDKHEKRKRDEEFNDHLDGVAGWFILMMLGTILAVVIGMLSVSLFF